MTRAEHFAAVRALPAWSPAWYAAMCALGAASKAGWPDDTPKKPGRPTGLSRGELYHRMLNSHVFDADRQAWLSKWYASPTAGTFDEMKQALDARKHAEKQAQRAA